METHRPSGTGGPTIILIGGPLTTDDGSSLDSRQPIVGDPKSHVIQTSLSTSLLWWLTTSSLVGRLLDSAGESAFALLVGNRSVVELRQDGSLRRTGLRAVLPGGTTELELIRTSPNEPLPHDYTEAHRLKNWDGVSMGTVGFKPGDPSRRWRFLSGNEYYLGVAGTRMGASVLIDTSETVTCGNELVSGSYEAFEQRRLFSASTIIVMPHSHRTESLVRGYLAWTQSGRPTARTLPSPVAPWDPTAPPDPIHYTCPVPIDAGFGVTGLVQGGEWRDPSDLEAARSLLQARYDLKIGIWDLVENPTLRRTLLATTPQEPAPTQSAPIPANAAKRAETRVATRMVEKAAEEQALREIATHMRPLASLGWKHDAREKDFLRLPLTADYPQWPGSDPYPLVQLQFSVTKRQSVITAFTILYNQVNITEYVLARRSLLEAIASPTACPLGKGAHPELWRAPGGWADDVDWAKRASMLAEHTMQWRGIFEDLCSQCKRAHAKKFQ